jgi:hypothetical protein
MSKVDDTLAEVHELFAEASVVIVKKFKADPEALNPALFKTVKEFLKDNHIEGNPVPGTPLGDLTREFPFETEVSPH